MATRTTGIRCGWWPAHVWTITLDDDVMSIAGRD
jgi:hypothetical protein